MAGTLIISLDFELFWGMLDVCPLEKYQDHVLGGRKAIPGLLALFQKYGIHAGSCKSRLLQFCAEIWSSIIAAMERIRRQSR